MLRTILRRPVFAIVAWLTRVLVVLRWRTCRYRWHGGFDRVLASREPFLATCFHQDMETAHQVMSQEAMRGRRIAAMVSKSRDGELGTFVLQQHRFLVVRGSSSRHGKEALDELDAKLRLGGYSALIVCDGPRPPARVVKYGIVALARRTQRPLWLLRTDGPRKLVLRKSWAKFQLVPPFSPIHVYSDGPIHVPPEAVGVGLERYRCEVQNRLIRLWERPPEQRA